MSLKAFFRGSFLSNTEYLIVPKITAAIAPAIKGAIPHEAATWETLPLSHDHLIVAWEANPTPTRAPTIVSTFFSQHSQYHDLNSRPQKSKQYVRVVETGIPNLVATIP